MKKTCSLILSALLVCLTLLPAFAADGVTVCVTVSDGSAVPALSAADVVVTDKDADGVLTIYDALYCAHEQNYKDGAEGFGTALTDYGVSLTKLWGKTSSAGFGFGYYVNDEAAFSLTDPVKDGDYVAAFLYTDAAGFSDAYSYFDVRTASAEVGQPLTLTLFKKAYVPPEWVLVSSAADNVVILIDGKETEFVTDQDGKAQVTFTEPGIHTVSARAKEGIIVPPACVVTVSALPCVTVTVCAGGAAPALACAPVAVADQDNDGALTVYDALYCAHEQYFSGGIAGFGTAATDYGVSMTKLWGKENGFGFGYYVNDEAALGLTDPVKDGDYVAAFLYTDLTDYSDAYSYFDVKTATVTDGKPLTLTLSKLVFVPPEYNADVTPTENAVILIDGEETAFTTDQQGKVAVTFADAGVHTVSAKAREGVIVPPACVVSVAKAHAAGDVDLDGDLTAADARLALRASVHLETLEEEPFALADVDKDGTITAADARMILRASVHLETL